MGRGFSIALAAVGALLIVLGLWVTFQFKQVALPDHPEPGWHAIQKHPAADTGGSLLLAGALCLVGAAINNCGPRT